MTRRHRNWIDDIFETGSPEPTNTESRSASPTGNTTGRKDKRMDYRKNMPQNPFTPLNLKGPANPSKYVFALFIDKDGNRSEFSAHDIQFDNPKWRDAVEPTLEDPKSKLRPAGRFWVHKDADPVSPIYFDDEQLIEQAEKLTHVKLKPEEAAKRLGFTDKWFVVEAVTYKDDKGEFVKHEPVEQDGHWFEATEEEIQFALDNMKSPLK